MLPPPCRHATLWMANSSQMLRTVIVVNVTSPVQTRYLVEGEAGMGKTLLAAHLAQDWAEERHLTQFGLLLLVSLGDFQGSLEQYILQEILPSYFDPEQ